MEKENKRTSEEEEIFLDRRKSIKNYGGHPSGKDHHMYGKKHTEETKAKIRAARGKQINTESMNQSRSEKLKGRKFSEESIEKMRQHALKRFADKKNHPHYGKKFSEEHIENISKSLKGRTLRDLHSPEKASEIRSKIKAARAKQVIPLQDTSIEVKIQDFLTAMGVEFIAHKYVPIKYAYRCDIFIPSMNMVIECDGDYWHGNLNISPFKDMPQKIRVQRCLDYERTAQMQEFGFNVLRLPEFEINEMTADAFKLKLDQSNE